MQKNKKRGLGQQKEVWQKKRGRWSGGNLDRCLKEVKKRMRTFQNWVDLASSIACFLIARNS